MEGRFKFRFEMQTLQNMKKKKGSRTQLFYKFQILKSTPFTLNGTGTGVLLALISANLFSAVALTE